MNNETTLIRRKLLDDGTVVEIMADGSTRPAGKGKTDWTRVDAMTDEEVEENALNDPDSGPETEADIAEAWGAGYLRETRSKLNLTQEQFAEKFQIPLGTLRDWERGASIPDKSARTLLTVIAKEPEAVLRAIAG